MYLHPTQIDVLRALAPPQERTVRNLCEQLGRTGPWGKPNSTITGSVRRLEKRGYVKRMGKLRQTTPEGMTALAAAEEYAAQNMNEEEAR